MNIEPIIAACIAGMSGIVAATIKASDMKASAGAPAAPSPRESESLFGRARRGIVRWFVANKRIAIVIALMAALGYAAVVASNRPDPGKTAIRQFYGTVVQDRASGWTFIHSERKTEIEEAVRQGMPVEKRETVPKEVLAEQAFERFCRAYQTCNDHQNRKIEFDKENESGRWYWVSFDATDKCRTNSLYDNVYTKPSRVATKEKKLMDRAALMDAIVENLSRYFEDVESKRAAIEAWVDDQPLERVMGPRLILDAFFYFKLKDRPTDEIGLPTTVNTHYIQHLCTKQDAKANGEWRIRSGLRHDELIFSGVYQSGNSLPHLKDD